MPDTAEDEKPAPLNYAAPGTNNDGEPMPAFRLDLNPRRNLRSFWILCGISIGLIMLLAVGVVLVRVFVNGR